MFESYVLRINIIYNTLHILRHIQSHVSYIHSHKFGFLKLLRKCAGFFRHDLVPSTSPDRGKAPADRFSIREKVCRLESIITGSGIYFSYDEEEPFRYVVDGVDILVRRGEFLAVLGHNGSGKSTLAKHFNAVLLPRMGRVLVDGMDTADEDHLYDIRQTVGMVFQNPDNQIVATVVEEVF